MHRSMFIASSEALADRCAMHVIFTAWLSSLDAYFEVFMDYFVRAFEGNFCCD